jgi:hypothetical protein
MRRAQHRAVVSLPGFGLGAHRRDRARRADRAALGKVRIAVERFGFGAHARGDLAQLGHAPVHDRDLAEISDHHVGRLQVAVDHAARVGVLHGQTDLQKDIEQPSQAELSKSGGVAIEARGQDLFQRATANQLHRKVSAAVGIESQVVNRNDVGVLELRGDLRLFDEAGQ